MPMPPHLAAAKERSMAKEAAKEAPRTVVMLGLRKTAEGYEVVRTKVPDTGLEVIHTADPLGFASQGLLAAVRRLVSEA